GDGAHVGDPRILTETLALTARLRGITCTTAAVTGLDTPPAGIVLHLADGNRLTADRAVIACGAWSRPLAAAVGDIVPLDTERGYNITL
ncbi:FAD-dependent oxidoreductase, partial [Acinetobacter baumannii]